MFFNASKFFIIIILLTYFLESAVVNSEKEIDTETQKPTSEEDSPNEGAEEQEDATTKELLEKVAEDITEAAAELSKLEEEVKEEEIEEKETEEKETEEESPSKEKEKESEEESTVTEETEQKADEYASTPETSPKEKSETTSALPMLVTEPNKEKEEAPKDAFAVWNSNGKICLLAKFHAVFSITYSSNGGEQKAEITVPKNANSKGKCESTTKSPLLQISWQKYAFTMMFNKSEEDNWFVSSMELTYDTSVSLFDRAASAGKKTARSKTLNLFETPLKKSYFCPAQEVVLLYTGKKQVVTARLKELHLQPYEVEDGQFSPVLRCNKVMIDGLEETPFVQDETVPLAVGCTLALITLIILVGFSIHRAYNAAKVDYNSME